MCKKVLSSYCCKSNIKLTSWFQIYNILFHCWDATLKEMFFTQVKNTKLWDEAVCNPEKIIKTILRLIYSQNAHCKTRWMTTNNTSLIKCYVSRCFWLYVWLSDVGKKWKWIPVTNIIIVIKQLESAACLWSFDKDRRLKENKVNELFIVSIWSNSDIFHHTLMKPNPFHSIKQL